MRFDDISPARDGQHERVNLLERQTLAKLNNLELVQHMAKPLISLDGLSRIENDTNTQYTKPLGGREKDAKWTGVQKGATYAHVQYSWQLFSNL